MALAEGCDATVPPSGQTPAATTVLPRYPRPGAALLRLTAAAFGVFTVLGSGLALAGMLVERTLPASTFAIFGGWQLNALAIGLGTVLLALLLVALVALVRRYRGLRGQTPHRRAVVLAAFLPGVFLGGLIGDPMASAVNWASHHTADANQARTRARELLAQDGREPPVITSGKAAAPAAVAARLVRRSDLGPGWYDQLRPNPSVAAISVMASKFGAAAMATAQFHEAHWTGSAWLPQHVVVESVLRFPSARNARRYLDVLMSGRTTSQAGFGATTVYETGLGGAAAWRTASFIQGAELFTVTINVDAGGTPTAKDFTALVAKSVARATSGR